MDEIPSDDSKPRGRRLMLVSRIWHVIIVVDRIYHPPCGVSHHGRVRTMYVRSIYPPVPPLEDKNAHYTILRRPDQAEWPNYTLYIDIVTGKKLMFYEFLERIHHGATYLGTPLSGGGLGINPDNGDIVGILSDNCIVSSNVLSDLNDATLTSRANSGLFYFDSCPSDHKDSLLLVVESLHGIRA